MRGGEKMTHEERMKEIDRLNADTRRKNEETLKILAETEKRNKATLRLQIATLITGLGALAVAVLRFFGII